MKVPVFVEPTDVVTTTWPVVAYAGTVTVIWESLTTVKVAEVPLNRTVVTPLRWAPEIVTVVPAVPDAGLIPLTLAATRTVKFAVADTVPPGVVIVIGPEVAPSGTFACTTLSPVCVKAALVPLNRTAVAEPTRDP